MQTKQSRSFYHLATGLKHGSLTWTVALVMLFAFNEGTDLCAQVKNPQSDQVKIGQNVLKYVITKATKEQQLALIQEKMLEQAVHIVYKDLKRNDRKELTGIRIEYESKKGSGEFFVNSDEPIKDIAITLNVNENKVFVGQAMKNLSQSFEVIQEDGGSKIKAPQSDNVLVYSTDEGSDDHKKVTVVGKDGDQYNIKSDSNFYVLKTASSRTNEQGEDEVFQKKNKNDTIWIHQDVENIVWTTKDGTKVEIMPVENGDKNTKLYKSNEPQPIVLLDGTEISRDELSHLKPETIENVNVLKGEEAVKNYGEKGKGGAILISSKNADPATQKNSKDSQPVSNPLAIDMSVDALPDDQESVQMVSNSSVFIDKNTDDQTLEMHKTYFKTKGVTFHYSKLKRNKDGLISQLKVELSTEDGQYKSLTFSNNKGISKISMGLNDGQLSLGSSDQ